MKYMVEDSLSLSGAIIHCQILLAISLTKLKSWKNICLLENGKKYNISLHCKTYSPEFERIKQWRRDLIIIYYMINNGYSGWVFMWGASVWQHLFCSWED